MSRVQTSNGRIILYDDPVYTREWVEVSGAIVPASRNAVTVGGHHFELATTRSGAAAYEFDCKQMLHGLKLFEVHGDKLTSTHYPDYDTPQQYRVGCIYREKVRPKMGGLAGGGYYFYLTENLDHFMYAFDQRLIIQPGDNQQYAVAECSAMGPFIGYDVIGRILPNSEVRRAKKLAASWLRIDGIIHTFWN